MSNFFSFISDGTGQTFYFNWEDRQKLLKENPKNYKPDSHSSIADFHGFGPKREAKLNFYEYNPLLKTFRVDQLNGQGDVATCERWVRKLNFNKVVALLVIKPILNPLKIKTHKLIATDKENLDKWASVWASVADSVWDSVWASVWASVADSVRDSVGASVKLSVWASVADSVKDSVKLSVWDSVGASVADSVGDSVKDSVWASVKDNVWAIVWVYISSFFMIKYKFDFSFAVNLWERGFVPSFDGKVWRLHQGDKAKIIYTMKEK